MDMTKEELLILRDFIDNEDTQYCYDWQGFNWEIILPLIDKLLKETEQLKAELEAMKELEDLTEDDIPWLRGEGEDA